MYMCICRCRCICICINTCVYIYIYVHLYVCIYIYIYICIHIRVCAHNSFKSLCVGRQARTSGAGLSSLMLDGLGLGARADSLNRGGGGRV